jgi:hypothetical protein
VFAAPALRLPAFGFAPIATRASRYSLCVPRPIVRPIGDPLLRFSLLQGSVRVALPASTGASPGFFGPRASAHFQRSAREPSPACGVTLEELARCADRLPASPPEGLACRRRWTLARHLSCASVRAAEVACAWRFRVCFAVGGRFLFRSRDPLPRFLVRRQNLPAIAGLIPESRPKPSVSQLSK